MSWSLRDTADAIEAEEVLKTLPDHLSTDDLFQDLVLRMTRDEEVARKARHSRMRERQWRLTEPRG